MAQTTKFAPPSGIGSVPLKDLVARDDNNVRKTEHNESLDQLVASIAAHGILQNLVVRSGKEGHQFDVIAGHRRHAALQILCAQNKIGDDYPVPCVFKDSAQALEISLTENAVREPMHPADQFLAFQKMVDDGAPVADIAARFGVTETVIKQRLKLANLCPNVMAAYRAGDLSLAQAQAFAVTDDHEQQAEVLANRQGWNSSPDQIYADLTDDRITAADKRVRFVTLAQYEAEGGGVERDLFAQDDRGIFITDAALLNKLVTQQLQAEADALKARGWSWVEVKPDLQWKDHVDLEQFYADKHEPVTPADQAKIDELRREYDALEEKDEDKFTDADGQRMNEIEELIDDLEDTPPIWPDEIKDYTGMFIKLDSKGRVEHVGPFARKESAANAKKVEKQKKKKAANKKKAEAFLKKDADDSKSKKAAMEESDVVALSQKLVEELSAHKSAAIAAALAGNPGVALAAVVHVLADRVFYSSGGQSCIDITMQQPAYPKAVAENSKGFQALRDAKQKWKFPPGRDKLFAWCLERKHEELLDLLATCAALSVNTITHAGTGRDKHTGFADELARALDITMRDWFTPTADNYFAKTSRLACLFTIRDVTGKAITPAQDKLKKDGAAAEAERVVAETDWLPEPLRIAPAKPKKEAPDDE